MTDNEDPTRSGQPDRGAQAQELRRRPVQCMVAPLPPDVLPAGVEPFQAEELFTRLAADPEIEHRKRIKHPEPTPDAAAAEHPEVAVMAMPPHRVAALVRDPRVHIERNRHIRVASPSPQAAGAGILTINPGVQLRAAPPTPVAFLVTGSDSGPIEGANIIVMSHEGNFQSSTGPDGRATLYLAIHDLSAITGVYVKPAANYWEAYQSSPEISTTTENIVVLRPLSETFPKLGERQITGWGLTALGLERIPPNYRGQGVKIAVIDSGLATGHPDLAGRVAGGEDFVEGGEGASWSVDVIGHGTHCAGVVAAADNGVGMLGITVEAELHVCKVFPDGRYSEVIEALNYCIEHGIDVVNLSMGADETSALLSQAIERAREAGVACIVAAGNSGGRVQFPGRLPSVLTVAAIGKLGQFPEGTYHAQQVLGQPDPQGYFSAAFTCYGPEVDVCAPGVAILSSVPDRGYAVWDGTSMATPHVTGLAALVLAHHPDFREGFSTRNSERVDRLFKIIKESCRPLDFGDPGRTGAGLPNAMRALDLEPSARAVTPELAQLREAMQEAGLLTSAGVVLDPQEQVRRLLQAVGLLPAD